MLKLHAVTTLALNLLFLGVATGEETPVMGRSTELPPSTPPPPIRPMEREAVRFESLSHGRYRFLIEQVRWSDGTEVKRVAAVYLEENEPMEIIALDDFTPPPSLSQKANQGLILDDTTHLAHFYFHVTAKTIDPDQTSHPADRKRSLPKCDPKERRAIARFAQPFQRARMVCFGFEGE
jgi:hypothetical protein